MVLVILVQPIYTLLPLIREGGFRSVTKGNSNLGKVVKEVPENHGLPPNTCICAERR